MYLYEGNRYSASYYLAGYAVELGIKACIAGLFQANVIPEKNFVNAVYSHKLDELLGLAGIKKRLQNDMRMMRPCLRHGASQASGTKRADTAVRSGSGRRS
jgi:hypothetical protein